MMNSNLSFRLFTDPLLSRPTKPITDFTGLEELTQRMLLTMISAFGVGLAANQVGIDMRLAVMNLENHTKQIVIANVDKICYNKSKSETLNEGCLSAPGLLVPIKRFTEVEFEFQNIYGEKKQMKLTGYDCRIFQHEVDHLFGKGIWSSIRKI